MMKVILPLAVKILKILSRNHRSQGCQMAYFHTKKSQFQNIFEGFGKKIFGFIYGHLVF
jgi:hypothetical protein